MKLTFNPTVYNVSIDGEKLCLQFLMVAFALSITYIICRPMRIYAKQYEKIKKKSFRLKARIDVVLTQQSPICASVLHHNVVRYRHSLVASYLKDFINENQYEPEKCSKFFSNCPQMLSNKGTSIFTRDTSENFDLICKLNTKIYPRKNNPSEGFDKLTGPKGTYTIRNLRSELEDRKNEFKLDKSPLKSKIFKTLEGPNRRLRSSLFEKRKTTIPRWSENLKAYTALTNTRLPLKVRSSYSKFSLQKKHVNLPLKEVKVNYSEHLDSLMIRATEDKNQETIIETEAMRSHLDSGENCFVGSSGCESECMSECSSDNSLEILPCTNDDSLIEDLTLPTIKEESSEDNLPSGC